MQLREAEQEERECEGIYNNFYKTVRRISPHTTAPLPSAAWRKWLRENVYSKPAVSGFFTTCVFVNVAIMGVYNDQMTDFSQAYNIQNHVFYGVMISEAWLTLASVGWVAYFEDRWSFVDNLVIIGSTIGYFVPESTFVRAFRLTRIFKVIADVPALRQMLETLTRSMVQIGNVVLLMLVVFSMYAILMVNFIGAVREGIPGPIYGGRIGSPKYAWPANPPNFASFTRSMVVLFQIVQGDDWQLMMHDVMVQPPFCTEQFDGLSYGDCGTGFAAAALMFISFKLIAEFVLMNLFIGMILDAFMKSEQSRVEFYLNDPPVNMTKSSEVTVSSHGTKYGTMTGRRKTANVDAAVLKAKVNRIYDKSCLQAWTACTGGNKRDFILISDVSLLMKRLPQPLGFSHNIFGESVLNSHDRAAVKLIMAELNLIAVNRGVSFAVCVTRLTAARNEYNQPDLHVVGTVLSFSHHTIYTRVCCIINHTNIESLHVMHCK